MACGTTVDAGGVSLPYAKREAQILDLSKPLYSSLPDTFSVPVDRADTPGGSVPAECRDQRVHFAGRIQRY